MFYGLKFDITWKFNLKLMEFDDEQWTVTFGWLFTWFVGDYDIIPKHFTYLLVVWDSIIIIHLLTMLAMEFMVNSWINPNSKGDWWIWFFSNLGQGSNRHVGTPYNAILGIMWELLAWYHCFLLRYTQDSRLRYLACLGWVGLPPTNRICRGSYSFVWLRHAAQVFKYCCESRDVWLPLRPQSKIKPIKSIYIYTYIYIHTSFRKTWQVTGPQIWKAEAGCIFFSPVRSPRGRGSARTLNHMSGTSLATLPRCRRSTFSGCADQSHPPVTSSTFAIRFTHLHECG